MKKFITSIVAALAMYGSAHTATYTLVLTNATTNVLSTTGWYISNITISQGASPNTNAVVNLYDNNVADIVYTNASYITRTSYTTNFTNVITNSLGALQTNVYPGLWTADITNAAATNVLPTVTSFTVPANTVQSLTANLATVKGLVATCNTTNCTITVTYNSR